MYKPNPVETSHIKLNDDIMALSEKLAKNIHEVWSAGRIAEGWSYGSTRNDDLKQHPCLIPYENLSENEKDYDRATAMETLKFIINLGFDIIKK